MRNFRANIRPAAIIDEGIGRRHRTPGFQHRQPRYQTRFVIGPYLSPAAAGLRGSFAGVMAARVLAKFGDTGAGPGGFGHFRQVGSPSWARFRFSGSQLASCSICFGLISFDKSRLAPGFGMSLTLAMLRCPDDVAPETRTVAGGEFSIGRAPENDWVLPDPERALSKRHCVLTFLRGRLAGRRSLDQRHVSEPRVRPDRPRRSRELRSGDRLSFGAYEIEVHVEEEGLAPRRTAPADPFAAHRSATPELFALDPFNAASERDEPGLGADPLLGGGGAPDPFAAPLAQAADRLAGGFRPARSRSRRARVPRPDPVGSLSASRERLLAAGVEERAARRLGSGKVAAWGRSDTSAGTGADPRSACGKRARARLPFQLPTRRPSLRRARLSRPASPPRPAVPPAPIAAGQVQSPCGPGIG